ncbi:hypothetical protein [Streptomyces hainanensis]|uniref:Uncharacterized protein n=1 Tax=Streptomyces hainanensis TaxID=402648 RepID=A0A4R4TSN5_9ACTN|nr:hypothetical protein [Streptomyces hainanensis]TDC78422.1 hypothetical protein E1283_05080 [Streptomyces hainanensis]
MSEPASSKPASSKPASSKPASSKPEAPGPEPPEPASPGGALEWLRARRGAGRLRRAGYTVYVTTVLFGAWGGTYLFGLLLSIERGGAFVEQAGPIADGAPYALPALSLAALALAALDALWRGPVVLPRHDADWLLPMPVPRWPLLRPWLLLSLGVLCVAGLVAGLGAALVFAAAGLGDVGPLLLATCPPAVGVALLAGGVAVAVQRLPAAARLARWLAVPALGVAGLLAVLAVAGEPAAPRVADVLRWSGPWGWAGQPALAAVSGGTPGWPVAACLLGAAVVAALAPARWLVTGMPAAMLRARSRAAMRVLAAALSLEPRTMRLALAGAAGGGAAGARLAGWRRRLRPPRSRALAVPWRGAVALLAEPRRVGWAVPLLLVAAVLLRAGTVGATALAAAIGYAAGARLLEAARLDADDPRRARLWWPGTAAGLAMRHTLLPGVVLTAVAVPLGLAFGTLPALLAAVPVLLAAGLVAAHQRPLPLWLLAGGALGRWSAAVAAVWQLSGPIAAVVALAALLPAAGGWLAPAVCWPLAAVLLRWAAARASVAG